MARLKQKARKSTGNLHLVGKPTITGKIGKKHQRLADKTVKKRPAKRGVVALREIKKYQHTTEHLIPFLPFSRLAREITQQVEFAGANMRWTKVGVLALQEAAETHIVQVLECANLIAIHAKRVTIMPRDMKLACRLMGLL
eukprot:TRINITY_DN3949_c0_g1_i10.p1 TRINITY_DN3949_c0_g1~~TRINITY_DN3949_c0_g1_i10.p1  ORF type:complete len:141 (+),score=12.77 TRINITY_DN3949_c0_g1_i10:158-580(+)